MSHPRLAGALRWTLVVAAMCSQLGACAPPPPNSSASAAELPEFTPAEAALFDDTIAMGVFGDELVDVAPAADPKLAERSSRADAVVPVKVSTVTRDTGADLQGYVIVVVPQGQPLAGSIEREPIEVEVTEQSPSFPFVKSADAGLVGQKLILFAKRYNDRGTEVLHWRLEPDTPELRAAIANATALEEIGE